MHLGITILISGDLTLRDQTSLRTRHAHSALYPTRLDLWCAPSIHRLTYTYTYAQTLVYTSVINFYSGVKLRSACCRQDRAGLATKEAKRLGIRRKTRFVVPMSSMQWHKQAEMPKLLRSWDSESLIGMGGQFSLHLRVNQPLVTLYSDLLSGVKNENLGSFTWNANYSSHCCMQYCSEQSCD